MQFVRETCKYFFHTLLEEYATLLTLLSYVTILLQAFASVETLTRNVSKSNIILETHQLIHFPPQTKCRHVTVHTSSMDSNL